MVNVRGGSVLGGIAAIIVILCIVAIVTIPILYTKCMKPFKPYKFYSLLDSKGGDIQQVSSASGNIDKLLELCTADPTCKGFRSTGWLKHTIKPQSEWTPLSGNDSANGLYIMRCR
jgi:hypothetical protein